MRRLAALLLLACGPSGGQRIGEDLDTAERPAARTGGCRTNCQSVDWVDREALAALADIAVCLDAPAYAPAGLRGPITITFRDLPCREAAARVAGAAGLKAVMSKVNGRSVLLLHHRAGEELVLLSRGDGRGGGAAGARRAAGSCLDGCAQELRSCKQSCGWNESTCMRSCEDRYRLCNQAC
jgi:hypothetical protein